MNDLSDTIACLGWGSLVWQPKELPVVGDWHHDGPALPLEFARHSGQKTGEDRLTLVLTMSGPVITTRWARLQVPDIESARSALRKREGCTLSDIGFYPGGSSGEFASEIAEWAKAKNLKGVVWTALPPKFANEDGRVPTQDEALAFLSGLTGKPKALAEEYVRMAPLAVQTPYRAAIEREFGWAALSKE
ncbi:hypothetical protein [Novosphingobium sp. KN65.2]|uniref:hypothetical protein n=1 Tax=Novosphingobium sp. KN65.2 TaxID=1478134 RepID=UPI0005E1B7E3|nr:hypothetical protein [Novosphingobium sp. KN65.2]CDO38565.1 conserved hypothetical protein [Novosphingobium sp. KN65.2]